MPCTPFNDGKVRGTVCTRGRRHPCRYPGCTKPMTKRCDYPDMTRSSRTCDKGFCDEHGVNVGPNRDHCWKHAGEPMQQGELTL